MLEKTQKITCKKNQKIHTLKKSKKTHPQKTVFSTRRRTDLLWDTEREPQDLGGGASRALSTWGRALRAR